MTRFNCGLYNDNRWPLDKNKVKIESNLWLENRFKLFELYCLPSIINQTNKNFIWLVFFDKQTPTQWYDKIYQYRNICKNYTPLFSNKGFRNMYMNFIKNFNEYEYEYIVSTRLDNDDGLSNNFVQVIHDNIIYSNLLFLNIINGYLYDHTKKIGYKFQSQSNPFITSIEHKSNFKTVFGWGKHGEIDKKYPTKNIQDGLWLQIIHDHNLINKIPKDSIKAVIPKQVFNSNNENFGAFV